MAHIINKHGKLVFKVLTKDEQTNIENWLIGKKLKFRVKKNKIAKKNGSKKGKTDYKLTDEQIIALHQLKELTLKDFAILYNKELNYVGYQGVYTKVIRNKRIMDYLLTKQILKYNVKYRTRLGITAPIVYFYINKEDCETLIDFFSIYLNSSTVDNYKQLKEQLDSRNKTELSKKLDYKKNKKSNAERRSFKIKRVKRVGNKKQ